MRLVMSESGRLDQKAAIPLPANHEHSNRPTTGFRFPPDGIQTVRDGKGTLMPRLNAA